MNLYIGRNDSGPVCDGTKSSAIVFSKSGRFNAVFSRFMPSVLWFSCKKIYKNKFISIFHLHQMCW